MKTMKTILKIILIILFLSPTIIQASHYNPFLDFDMLNNTDTNKKPSIWDILDNMTVEEMQNLLDQGFDVNQDYHGTSIFGRIVSRGIIDVVALLIESGTADINAKDKGGDTALHEAAYSNRPEIIQLLIDAGADIEARTNYGATPLYHAAEAESIDAARILLQLGANPNITTTYNDSTAFMRAVKYSTLPYDQSSAEERARDEAKGITPRTLLELLIEYGADPHAVDNEGNNARAYIHPERDLNARIVKNYLDELGVK